MRELQPGAMTRVMLELAAVTDIKLQAALTAVAEAVRKQAVINASTGAHPYGTPTPARPGTGPARISGTLVRSIAQSDLKRTPTGWEIRVGLLHGLYPTYRGHRGAFTSKTPSHEYGGYLEPRFPWLLPAFHHGVHIVTPVVMAKLFL